jgi:hypothetical protein
MPRSLQRYAVILVENGRRYTMASWLDVFTQGLRVNSEQHPRQGIYFDRQTDKFPGFFASWLIKMVKLPKNIMPSPKHPGPGAASFDKEA